MEKEMSTEARAEIPIVLVWENAEGKLVRAEELTRDELLAALHQCVLERDQAREQWKSNLRMMRAFSRN